jgi:iron-sulfur cluster assembly accessory protein
MITVTDSAVKQLQALLAERAPSDAAEQGLRLSVDKGGCAGLQYGLAIEPAQANDSVISTGGVNFFIAADSAAYLSGSTIDYDDGLSGAGFRILNPNAARSCGCGTSFAPTGEEAAAHTHS